eukprot:scaffold202693_cov66-Cyclotella_meneghiniana.AAC.1
MLGLLGPPPMTSLMFRRAIRMTSLSLMTSQMTHHSLILLRKMHKSLRELPRVLQVPASAAEDVRELSAEPCRNQSLRETSS